MTTGQWIAAIAVGLGVACVALWARRRPTDPGDQVSQAWRDEHVRLRER